MNRKSNRTINRDCNFSQYNMENIDKKNNIDEYIYIYV